MCLATKTEFLKTQESFQLVNLILIKKKNKSTLLCIRSPVTHKYNTQFQMKGFQLTDKIVSGMGLHFSPFIRCV